MTDLSKYTLNAEEAAKQLNINSSTIRRWCKSGKIDCHQIGTGRHSIWLVNPISLNGIDRKESGRPRKPKS